MPPILPLFSVVQLFYQAAGNVCNNGCHDKLDEGKVQEMVTGMLGDVSACMLLSLELCTYVLYRILKCTYVRSGVESKALRHCTIVYMWCETHVHWWPSAAGDSH